jgi:hypothetical protein
MAVVIPSARAEDLETSAARVRLSGNAAVGFAPASTAARARPAAPVQISGVTLRSPEDRAIERWKISLIPFAVSQTLDISSSWGMRELNPALAGKDGRFGFEAALLKLGVVGAFVGVESLVVRRHPRAARAFEKINWSGAALTSGFAAHNYMIR